MAFPNTVSTVAGFNIEGLQNGDIGPYQNGSNRYMILFDGTALKLRAYKSTDQGATWAEMDAAHAPAVGNDTPAPNFFEFYAVAQDQAGNAILYAVYNSAAHVIAMTPFSMATDTWGAAVASTLAMGAGGTTDTYGIAAIHRGSDNTLFVGLSPFQSVNSLDQAAIAKLAIGSSTWDGAFTNIGQNPASVGSWGVAGFCQGSSNNIHVFLLQAAGNGHSTIQMQTIHPDNSIAAMSQVFAENLTLDAIIVISRPVLFGSEIVVSFTRFNNRPTQQMVITVARGVSGDAPTWTVTNVVTGLSSANQSIPGIALAANASTLVLAYMNSLFANPVHFTYWTNTGVANPWNGPNIFADGTPRGNFDLGASQYLGAALFIGSTLLAMNFPFFGGGALMGYFESPLGGPATPVNMGPSSQGNFNIPGNPGGLVLLLPDPRATYQCRYSQTFPCEIPQGDFEERM